MSEGSEPLQVLRRGDVMELRLHRPSRHNALDEELIAALCGALRAADEDEGLRALLLSGEGKSFCAGADIEYMRRLAAADEKANLEDARRLGELFSLIQRCRCPVIARVHGVAMGGAIGLVAAADFAVAADDTRFAFSEVRLGLVPAVISPFVLRRMGPARCRRLFLSAERFDAQQALRWGLLDEVAAEGELDQSVGALLDRLRRGGPQAQAACKRLLDEIEDLPLHEAVMRTPPYIAKARAGEEAREGFGSFFEKRDPAWFVGEEDG